MVASRQPGEAQLISRRRAGPLTGTALPSTVTRVRPADAGTVSAMPSASCDPCSFKITSAPLRVTMAVGNGKRGAPASAT